MKIIAFTGMSFSGKTEAVKIAKEKNIPVIRMGDQVWEEVKQRNLELNDKNVGHVADEMRKIHGKNIWAKKTVEKIKSLGKKDTIVIDGIRNIEEIDLFKKKIGENFIIIAIDVSDRERYKRAKNRGRKDDSNDIEKIKERDQREINWGLKDVINNADIMISNEGNLDDFRKKIKDVLKKL